jgi:hypothetical protein
MDKLDNTIEKVEKIYSKLTYFDEYGGSVIILILITIIVFLIITFSYYKSYAIPIANDWPNQRCNVAMLPYAGFIYHPSDTTAVDYTQENFNYCTQQILKSVSEPAVAPITSVTDILNEIANSITSALQQIREVMSRIIKVITDVVKNIYNRFLNITSQLTEVVYKTQDVLQKSQAMTTTATYTIFGSYTSLQSLLGAIATFVVELLIALTIVIVILIMFGAAGPFILEYIILATVFGLFLSFMRTFLGITGYDIPQLKCFDKNTQISMNDGTKKNISEIKLGDILENNNEVTSIICVETKGSDMYYLNNILVSDTHIVKYNNKWIPVSEHPNAIKNDKYNEPYLYCLNTTNKTIVIDNIIFTDWDEIYDKDIENIFNKLPSVKSTDEIHKQLNGGFEENTIINLYNGEYKKIKDILIGDKLINGERVYGVVVIDGKKVNEQFKYILGEKLVVEGGPNLVYIDSKKNILSTLTLNYSNENNIKKYDKLYHLLTDKKTFNIGDIKFCDYNANIDIFLENKIKKYYL